MSPGSFVPSPAVAGAFAFGRDVLFDPARELILVDDRRFWFFQRRLKVPFLRVLKIQYDYEEVGPWLSLFRESGDTIDRFHVGLRLCAPEDDLVLFSFTGEGTGCDRSALEVILPDLDPVDSTGDQEATSRNFLLLLKRFTGKPIV
jgi:hypothetical protein